MLNGDARVLDELPTKGKEEINELTERLIHNKKDELIKLYDRLENISINDKVRGFGNLYFYFFV